MTVPRSAPGEDSGGSHQPRFRGATDRKYGRHALQCNKESPPGDVAEMLRLRVSAEGRMVKIGAFAHSRLEPLHALLRGAAPRQMCRSATCPEWGQFCRVLPVASPRPVYPRVRTCPGTPANFQLCAKPTQQSGKSAPVRFPVWRSDPLTGSNLLCSFNPASF